MAVDKLVDSTQLDADLTTVANAIRTKGETSAYLSFPNGFAAAIADISGGATEPYTEETYDASGNLIGAVLHGHTKIRAHFFRGCSYLQLNSLPSDIEHIGSNAFEDCRSITSMTFPATLKSIESYAFNGSTVQVVTFEGTPSGIINSRAFSGCANLTTINVPWAENAVANAPWGATNATINYNYVPSA